MAETFCLSHTVQFVITKFDCKCKTFKRHSTESPESGVRINYGLLYLWSLLTGVITNPTNFLNLS